MKKPRSIEANLVSLGSAAALLVGVLVLTLFGVERALGARLERLGGSTMPAQQASTRLRYAVSLLFERQVEVLSTRSTPELEPLRSRTAIERALAESRGELRSVLPELVGGAAAGREDALLGERTREVLATDAALFASVETRLAFEAQFQTRTVGLKKTLEQLTQEASALAGIAHLDYVLELRRVAAGGRADKLIHGNTRAQQDAAEDVVTAVLGLGQLVGKLALAQNQDELNSIVANELAQNLDRARTHLRVLTATLEPGDPAFSRAEQLEARFEKLAAQISDPSDANSLVELRRHVLAQASQAVELRGRIAKSVVGLSSQLEAVERIVAHETQEATRSARRSLWVARLLSPLALAAVLGVGLHSARRLRESVRALRVQNGELESLSRDLKHVNEGLEGLVAERSAALVARERSMRLVLDAMSEGLISADLAGGIAGECSKAALAWFGAADAGTPLSSYLFPNDERLKLAFEMGYAQMTADMLPFEVCADCMPKRFEKDGRSYALDYRQVFEDGRFARVLVVVRDITHELETEASEREAREQHRLLAHLLEDKQGFLLFVRDSERILSELAATPELEQAQKLLHTLKGNTGVYGMESMARRCHELEDALAERADRPTPAEIKALSEFWRQRLTRIADVLTAEGGVELKEEDFAELVHGLRQRRDYLELIELVQSFKWTPASVVLRRLAAQVQGVAERLGKHVDVRIEDNGLRVMPGTLEEFWSSLVHVVRNAVDHGIESEEERLTAGKPAAGHLSFRISEIAGGGFSLELADDGRGLDFERLRAACERRGFAAKSNADLIEGMFQNGVTTRDEATEFSGRGVGLGAVASACRSAGGRLEVESTARQGTCFRFVFPQESVQVRRKRAPQERSGSSRPSKRALSRVG